jgi:hypothetical protein
MGLQRIAMVIMEGNKMNKKLCAAEVSLCAVVLLVLGSLNNVVGYQTVQSSNQSVIKERINQRELLFQTIVDIANNKEIQRIILKSQMSRGIFQTTEFPVVTKTQIRQMYFIGLILSKIISKSRIQSMIGKYQFNNQEIQKEINAVIEKDITINSEITQLKNYECDCESNSTITWSFPVVCKTLTLIIIGLLFIAVFFGDICLLLQGIFKLSGYVPLIFMFFIILLMKITYIPFDLLKCPPIPFGKNEE